MYELVPVVTVVELKVEVWPWSTVLGVGVTVGATRAEFTVTETASEAGEVTGVEALSVTSQVTECKPVEAV
jgi:hypothetical protein